MQVSEAVQTSSSDGKQPHCYYFGPKLLTRRIHTYSTSCGKHDRCQPGSSCTVSIGLTSDETTISLLHGASNMRTCMKISHQGDSYCSHFIAILLIISIVPKTPLPAFTKSPIFSYPGYLISSHHLPTYLPTYLPQRLPANSTHHQVPRYTSDKFNSPNPTISFLRHLPTTPELSLTNPPVPNRDPANRYISPSKPQSDTTNSAMLFPPHRARANKRKIPSIHQP
ncbi:uncharacterized protein RAG0_17394 [Rhynchosporium agropyri]|uniref:Uncharacterized protein n=1 Tax=Rhynchosporium agropyri TaxID=914238 RepID=A0A1E1LTW1_9HELO|nr:uncharacterized protein RAG0_17394 [Rhynchosporium agropyri]